MQDQSHLLYQGFLAVIDDIARQHPGIQRLANTAAAMERAERAVPATVEGRLMGAERELSEMENENGSYFRPKDRRLLVVLKEYLLVKSEPGREVMEAFFHLVGPTL